jgi:hypothetical protein
MRPAGCDLGSLGTLPDSGLPPVVFPIEKPRFVNAHCVRQHVDWIPLSRSLILGLQISRWSFGF